MYLHKKIVFFFFINGLFIAAISAQPLKQFTLLPESATGVGFRNIINETPSMFYYLDEYLYNGSGVSIGDINNDGLSDLYFSSTNGSNKLYLNLGGLRFSDITESAGVNGGEGIKTGVSMVDINNDGYEDIFICKSGYKDASLRKKILYINNGNLTFTDKAVEYGLQDASFTTQAYFFDYDNDGDKDVYFVNHPGDFSKSMIINGSIKNGVEVYNEDTNTVYVSDRLYENKGNVFIDVTKKAGLINHTFGLSAAIADINGDGWADIYTANDFVKPDYLYINNKNGTFTEKLSSYISHISFFSMGSDIVDLNNDGNEDIIVLDMAAEDPVRKKQLFVVNQNYDKFNIMVKYQLYFQYPHNCFQINNGNGSFSEIANYAGVAETDWSWSPMVADFDNDGWKDLYVTNGLKRDVTDWDYKVFVLDSIMNTMNKGKNVDLNLWLQSIPSVPIKNYFYRNNGSLKFDNFTDIWSDSPPSFSSGAAYADLDNDGDLEIVVNNVDAPAFILKNNTRELSSESHFLRFKFYKTKNSFDEVYGVTVKLTNDMGEIQFQHYQPHRGFLSTMEHVLHFGTGKDKIISKIEIIFPSQKMIQLENISTDQLLVIYESDADLLNIPTDAKQNFVFKDITSLGSFKFTQAEDDFIDFKREPLIPYKCSRKGPYFASADVNADGLLDVYIGGAAGFEAKLMIQDANGSFTEKKQSVFTTYKGLEDMDAVFVDVEGDGDKDLYVVSGGAAFDAGSTQYQDRLYLNDSKGNFAMAEKAIPVESNNGSTVISLDFDKDNDLDLFVGGHVMPGVFPKADQCMLLQNNRGVFTDVTNIIAKELINPGIVNQAIWADIDGDGAEELSICGEWMPLEIYGFQEGQFRKKHFNVQITLQSKKDSIVDLNTFTGWWYCMKASDIDNDGDLDIVLGNRGLNSLIKSSYNEPCMIYAKDFDNNGSYDAVLGYYIQGKCYPFFSRDQLIDQMPMMRKKFVRYKDYSGKTMDEIFTGTEKKDMVVYKTSFFESGVLINEGHETFRFIPFPEMAQLSTINDLIIDDMDHDGIMDLLVCGNSNDPNVMVGNYDATSALLLKGKGEGFFESISMAKDGISVKGECRRMIYLKNAQEAIIIFLKNSHSAQVFSKKY